RRLVPRVAKANHQHAPGGGVGKRDRNRTVAFTDVRRQQRQRVLVDRAQVFGQRRRYAVQAREPVSEGVDIEEAELDEVGAQPAAVFDLDLQRIRELLRIENASGDQ